jgi:hypothetical protein
MPLPLPPPAPTTPLNGMQCSPMSRWEPSVHLKSYPGRARFVVWPRSSATASNHARAAAGWGSPICASLRPL